MNELHPMDDRLWDPSATGGPRIEDLEARLASLRAATPLPELALPPRSGTDAEGATRARGIAIWGAVVLAAILAALWVGRARMLDAPGAAHDEGAVAVAGPWRVKALDSETQCGGVELAEGDPWPEDAAIETGDGGTAHLERGAAELILHPAGRLARRGETLVLEQGRLWADLPDTGVDGPWAIDLGGQVLDVREGRLVLWVEPGEGGGFEVLRGSVELGGIGGPEIAAGQTCRARFDPGPLLGLGAFDCGSSDDG